MRARAWIEFVGGKLPWVKLNAAVKDEDAPPDIPDDDPLPPEAGRLAATRGASNFQRISALIAPSARTARARARLDSFGLQRLEKGRAVSRIRPIQLSERGLA
jgi:hypothetical protein